MSSIARSEAAEIATLCTDCGVPEMAAKFLAEGISLDEAKTRVSAVGVATDMVAMASRLKPDMKFTPAKAMLAAGLTVPQVRASIFDKMIAEEERTSISSHAPLPGASGGAHGASESMKRELRAQGMTPKSEAGR